MILEAHDRFGPPARLEATRVLVRDPLGNAVALLLQMGPRQVRLIHAGEAGFAEQLARHGLGEAPRVQTVQP